MSDLNRINLFLQEHHVLSLATNSKDEISVCNLFYAYSKDSLSFIVASSEDTTHIKNITESSRVAGSIVLETKTIGKIQGVQFRGKFIVLNDKLLKQLYFKTFPYAVALRPKLWQIKIDFFKMTDNRLGFGKKIIWQDSSV